MNKLWGALSVSVLGLALCVPILAQNGANRYAPGGNVPTDPIAREVRHELLMLPYYGVFDNLQYSVNDGNVTLQGQVTDPVLKSDAESVVKHIEGVKHVDNKIEVLPLSSFDNQSRIAEYRAIYGYPALNRYAMEAVPSIHIIVNNGHVTLTGVVDSQSDKDLAALRAKTVGGVFSVTNDLQVAPRQHNH